MKSYFDPKEWERKVAEVETRQEGAPWFCRTLWRLGARADKFELTEDKDRFVVEYIYPH